MRGDVGNSPDFLRTRASPLYVYFDTQSPKNGKSWVDLTGPSAPEARLTLAKDEEGGWLIPVSVMPVSNPPFTAPLLKPVTDPIVITVPSAAAIPRSIIYRTDKEKNPAGSPVTMWRSNRRQQRLHRAGTTMSGPRVTLPGCCMRCRGTASHRDH